MSLENFVITTRPNKWNEPNWVRSFYDIEDKRTGEKTRVPSHFLFNLNPFFIEKYGEETAKMIHDEIIKREKEIFETKQEYLDTLKTVKAKIEAGMRIPRSQFVELENMFDDMKQKDSNLGNFDNVEVGDEIQDVQNTNKKANTTATDIIWNTQSSYIPKTSNATSMQQAPHWEIPGLQESIVEDDDWYEGQDIKMAMLKCKILLNLKKDEAGTAGPTPSMTAGYVNPPISSESEGYNNVIYNKKKKPGKTKKYIKG